MFKTIKQLIVLNKLIYILIFVLLISITDSVFSQGEIAERESIVFKNEYSLGLGLYSNGFGADFVYGKRVNARLKTLYSCGLNIVKHPKEKKIYNPDPFVDSQERFVFGKLNHFYTFKGGMGLKKEVFSKADKGSISISYSYNVGGILGILKPIYYHQIITVNPDSYETIIDKFNESIHSAGEIYGRAHYKYGLDEISLVPGAYGKFDMTFEYSSVDSLIRAIQVGVQLDVYPKRIPILAVETNNQLMLSIFIIYRFGRIVDSRGLKRQAKAFKKSRN